MRRHAKAATAGSTKRLGRSKPALLACVLAASVAALALVVGSASGATTRFLVETFGSSAQPAFPADRGMAFDQGSNQLYVIDSTNDTISRFNANGTAADFGALGSNVIDGEGTGDETPLGHLAFEANRQREQLAIDESGGATDGNVYATRSASDVVDVFSSSGEYKGTLSESTGTGAFGEPCGVAVDASGTVYVGDRGDDRIHVYVPAGAVPVNADNTASFATVTDPCTLAAGAGATAGFLFVNASTGAQLRKVDATTGEVKYEIASGGSTVSVDPTTGHVFVARNTGSSSSVDEYDASGAASATLVSSFKPGQTVEGIALNSGSEQVYVARSGSEAVEVFGPAAVIPDVVTSPPSSNTGIRATLAGTVNPDGVELDECFFEWGQGSGSTAYTEVAPCAETPAEIGAGTAPVAVHADINGLTPQGTQYHYRLVAVNPNGTVNGSNQNFITPDTAVTQAASGVTPTEATLNGTVNPDGTALTECVFEWGPEKEPYEAVQKYTETAPCVPSAAGIGSGTSPIAVEAGLSGLHPGTTYHYRLKAANANGPILGKDMSVQSGGPVIADQWATSVVRTEATLKTSIDPEGSPTSFRVEYGTSPAYGEETPETNVGSDSSLHTLTVFLDGLSPGTTYHYRVVATSGVATNEGTDQTFTTYDLFTPDTDCPNQSFRTGPSLALPDCRAYEMVSPVDKNGGDIYGLWGGNSSFRAAYEQASLNGEKITYSSGTSFGGQLGSLNSNQYLSSRGPSGWSTDGINPPIGAKVFPTLFFPPNEYYFDSQYQAFSEDLSSAWVLNGNKVPLTSDAAEGFGNLYRRNTLSGAFEALTVNEATSYSSAEYGEGLSLEPRGASTNNAHQIFDAKAALTPNADASAVRQVYDFHDGELHLVSVLPSGYASVETDSYAGGPTAVGNGGDQARTVRVEGAVSADGSRIFWSHQFGALFVRQNPAEEQSALSNGGAVGRGQRTAGSPQITGLTTSKGTFAAGQTIAGQGIPAGATITAVGAGTLTMSVNASEGVVASGAIIEAHSECTEPAKACTRRISLQRRALFWNADREGSRVLYGEDDGNGTTDEDLFLFDVDTQSRTLIAKDVNGVLGASDDLSRVYFISREVLDGGATAGEYNLYLDSEGTKSFLATVSKTDVFGRGPVTANPFFHDGHVTPDGRRIAFKSSSTALSRMVAGYDNTDAVSGEPDMQVYTYEVGGDLLCASCNPSGARPLGGQPPMPYTSEKNVRITEYWVAAWIPPSEHAAHTPRVISDDGNRIFFNSLDPLLPEDTNGVQDVYQWEAPGAGTCEEGDASFSPLNGGCISLITTGESPEESEFIDADAAGEDVFVRTEQSIDPRDPGSLDIYDVRAGGGYPLPPSPPECAGDSCQSPPQAPNDPTPASAGFRGAGTPMARLARSCGAQAKRAAQLSRKAKKLRHQAKRASSNGRSKAMQRRAARLARKAKGLSKRANRCRRANRRAKR